MKVAPLMRNMLAIALISVAVFGFYFMIFLPMEQGMGCPFSMGHTAVCALPFAHIEHWQNLFVATAVMSIVAALLTLIAVLVFSRGIFLWLAHQSPQPFFATYHPDVATYDVLRRFIARGLMHPKVF